MTKTRRKFDGHYYEHNALYHTKAEALEEQKELKKYGWNIRITKIKPYLGYSWQTWKRTAKGYRSAKK